MEQTRKLTEIETRVYKLCLREEVLLEARTPVATLSCTEGQAKAIAKVTHVSAVKRVEADKLQLWFTMPYFMRYVEAMCDIVGFRRTLDGSIVTKDNMIVRINSQ